MRNDLNTIIDQMFIDILLKKKFSWAQRENDTEIWGIFPCT